MTENLTQRKPNKKTFEQQQQQSENGDKNSDITTVGNATWQESSLFFVAGSVLAYTTGLLGHLADPTALHRPSFVLAIVLTGAYVGVFAYLSWYIRQNPHVRMDYRDMQVHRPGWVEMGTVCVLLSGIAWISAVFPVYGLLGVPLMIFEFLAVVAGISLVC